MRERTNNPRFGEIGTNAQLLANLKIIEFTYKNCY
jgi:hypothetical protein